MVQQEVMQNQIAVIVLYEGMTVQCFDSMRQACLAYGISYDRLMRLIQNGEELDGVCFDFPTGTDTEQAERKWRERKAYEAQRKRQWRIRNAVKKEM